MRRLRVEAIKLATAVPPFAAAAAAAAAAATVAASVRNESEFVAVPSVEPEAPSEPLEPGIPPLTPPANADDDAGDESWV